MGVGDEVEVLTPDDLDQIIVDGELEIAQIRARQMTAIQAQRAANTHVGDGYRSIVDWVAARADIGHQTARKLCWTANRLGETPEVADALAGGEITFDRAEQLSRLPGSTPDDNKHLDIGQLRKKATLHRRIARSEEMESARSQYLNVQPDEMRFNVWGEFDAMGGALAEKALDQRADELITEGATSVAERRALAFLAICQDSLHDSHDFDRAAATELMVTIDAAEAVDSGGKSGVSVLNGPRIGTEALDAIMCNAVVEVTGIAGDGSPLNMGRRSRTIPPQLRRHVLRRDMGCSVDGCSSRYRLQVHHDIPWSRGGPTDADNLVTLCWFHHHVVIHRWGYTIDRIGESRIRLVRPDSTGPP